MYIDMESVITYTKQQDNYSCCSTYIQAAISGDQLLVWLMHSGLIMNHKPKVKEFWAEPLKPTFLLQTSSPTNLVLLMPSQDNVNL
jgi:hypothetical protein